MRTKTLIAVTLLFLASIKNLNAQNNNRDTSSVRNKQLFLLKQKEDSALRKYVCSICDPTYNRKTNKVMAVQSKVLNADLKEISAVVIPNVSANLVTNNSALGYVKNDDGSVINLNAAFMPTGSGRFFINAGIMSKTKDKAVGIYTGGSWSGDAGLTLGATYSFGSRYLNSEVCAKLRKERKDYFNDEVYNSFVRILGRDTIEINDRISCLKNRIILQNSFRLKDTANFYPELRELENKLDETRAYMSVNAEQIDSIVHNLLIDYDTRHNILQGYRLFWVGVNFGVFNKSINFKNDSILAEHNIISINNRPKLTVDLNINWSHSGVKTFQYIQIASSFLYGNILDNPLVKDAAIVVDSNNAGNINIINNNSEASKTGILAPYNSLKEAYCQLKLGGYYANFFILKRSIGLSVQANCNINIRNPLPGVLNKPSYSLLMGPVFRMQNEAEWNKATFGISCGFENAESGARVWRLFSSKIFVSLPFNIFTKS